MIKNIYLYTDENKYVVYKDIYKVVVGNKYIGLYGNDDRKWEIEKENYINDEEEL